MKRITIFVFLLLVCSLAVVPSASALISTGDTGWVWQNPLPQGNTLLDVCFVDGSHGWAVGYFGTIVATSDGGVTWTSQASGTYQTLYTVCFTDTSHGWAAGYQGTILLTTDGGATWMPCGSGASYINKLIYDVAFVDTLHGWAVTDSYGDTILATGDGGATWTEKSVPYGRLHAIDFADPMHGWAVGDAGNVIATTDGGATWTLQTTGAIQTLNDVSFVDAWHGCAVGDYGCIVTTSDGGSNWSGANTDLSSPALRAVDFADASHGWAVGDQGYHFRTTDGGATWTKRYFVNGCDLQAVSFVDGSRGWLAGEGGLVLSSSDGGASWQRPTADFRSVEPFVDVSFADAAHGTVIGNDRVLTTADGGATWTKRSLGTSSPLTSACCADASHFWVVTADGGIYATTDGGASWTSQSSGTTSDLNRVRFADASHGWVAGDNGTILVTTDGGAHWKAQSSGVTWDLLDISVLDSSRAWVVGWHMVILATKNGGATWVVQKKRLHVDPWTSVSFADALHGWVCEGQRWAVTTDGGATWSGMKGTPCTATTVAFTDAKHGWMVGAGSGWGDAGIYVTKDGGIHWTPQAATVNDVWNVCFVDARHGWAVGENDTILATSTAGLPPIRTSVAGAVKGRWYTAPVALTLNVTDDTGGIGIASTEYRLDDGDWVRGRSLTVSGEGPHVLLYRSADNAGNVEYTHRIGFGIDRARPTATAPFAASAGHYRTVTLKCKVTDPLPNGGSATVTVKIKNRSGRVVKTVVGWGLVNKPMSVVFDCYLPRGVYRFYVYAKDTAGNPQTLPIDSNRLTIR